MKLKLGKTKLIDDYGRPIPFYHTTNVLEKIERFHPLSHFGTKKAAEMRGIHLIYQILGIHEPAFLPEELPEKIQQKLDNNPQSFLKTYQVHLCIKSPLQIVDFGQHNLKTYNQRFSSFYSPKSIYLTSKECLERDNIGVEKMTYKKALTEFIFLHPFKQSIEDLKKELKCESLFSSNSDDKTELAKDVAYQRMIRYLETEGYDGFSYNNDCEDIGQKSYIIFRPEQVFSISETEHEIPKISPENQHYLNQIETDFFQGKGILPPHQRKELNRQIRANHLIKLTK